MWIRQIKPIYIYNEAFINVTWETSSLRVIIDLKISIFKNSHDAHAHVATYALRDFCAQYISVCLTS